MITWAQLGFQDASSPVIEEFVFFHDYVIIILTVITTFVGGIMLLIFFNPWVNRGLLEGQLIECIWTLTPAVILVQIAIPSLLLLYLLEEGVAASLTLKAVGHQWYWSYEYSDLWREGQQVEFDSYIVPVAETAGAPRLLDTDNRTPLPHGSQVRVLVGSADVLHSWTVPALGVKADACPGRLNQVRFLRHRPGLLFGQCSEICGANHRFIPIALELTAPADFLSWVEANI